MKAINQDIAVKQPKTNLNHILKTTGNLECRIINFSLEKNYCNVQIDIKSITSNNYNVFVEKSKLVILVAEIKEYNKPIYSHNIKNHHARSFEYEMVKYINVWLPDDNFLLLKHYLDVEKGILKVLLKKSSVKFA